jgi:hypothetical protein
MGVALDPVEPTRWLSGVGFLGGAGGTRGKSRSLLSRENAAGVARAHGSFLALSRVRGTDGHRQRARNVPNRAGGSEPRLPGGPLVLILVPASGSESAIL